VGTASSRILRFRHRSLLSQDETVATAETNESLPDETVTVASDTDEGPVATYDTDGNGINAQELGAAAGHCARGNLTIADLGAVSASYARS